MARTLIRQLVRPDGTVVAEVSGPEGLVFYRPWGSRPLGGPLYGRLRAQDEDAWRVVHRFPNGYPYGLILWDSSGECRFTASKGSGGDADEVALGLRELISRTGPTSAGGPPPSPRSA